MNSIQTNSNFLAGNFNFPGAIGQATTLSLPTQAIISDPFGTLPSATTNTPNDQPFNFGQATNTTNNTFGIVPPSAGNTPNGQAFNFGQDTNTPRQDRFGLVLPEAPERSSGENIIFSQNTNQPSTTFGITPPTLAPERQQVNVTPVVPEAQPTPPGIQAPQQQAGNPTYPAGSYPVPGNQQNPQLESSPAQPGNPTYPAGSYPVPGQQQNPVLNTPTAPPGSPTYPPAQTPQPGTEEQPTLNSPIPQAGYPTYPGGALQGTPTQNRQNSTKTGQPSSGIPTPEGYNKTEVAPGGTFNIPRSSSSDSQNNYVDLKKLNPVAAKGIQKYGHLIQQSAERNGVDPSLLAALLEQESHFDPKAFNSSSSATGLGQLLPSTARELGVKDIHDPAENIEGAARYLGKQLKANNGDVELALAAYNWGPGNVARLKNGSRSVIPKETLDYIKQIPQKQQVYQKAGLA